MTRMAIKILTVLVLALCLQASEPEEYAYRWGRKISFPSKVYNKMEHYIVHLPDQYETGNTDYPVLFVMNGHMQTSFSISAATAMLLGNEFTPKLIVIGIDLADKPTFPLFKENRVESYDKIFAYLKQEIIPDVEKRYRTSPYRILYGQSNSATCATFLMFREPSLFHAYIMASPMLGWCYDRIEMETRKMLESLKGTSLFYFMSYGENDYKAYVNDYIPQYQRLFDSLTPERPVCFSEVLKHQGHVPVAALNNGLHLLFKDYYFNEEKRAGSLADVIAHYQSISQRMGFTMPVPEEVLFDMGYMRYQAEKNDEALSFFKETLKQNPKHRNALRFIKAIEENMQKKGS